LWEHPYSNYQLVLREDGVIALSGQMGREVGMGAFDLELSKQTAASRKFDPLTGEVLAEIDMGRRACTRPTGAIDAVFCRAQGGSTRLDTESNTPGLISPMRAQCHDGVTIANGLLYWWPSTCDCNLSIYGITALGPAGDFDFESPARADDRLTTFTGSDSAVEELSANDADWPTYRANPSCSVTTKAVVPATTQKVWQFRLPPGVTPTAPTSVGELVFVAGSDGMVHALGAGDGQAVWTAFTGGAVRHPPTIAEGRALVGAGDGWVYAWEAKTGRPLWEFRAAPADRRIPVYGQLLSTWPAASGVAVDGDTAYVAAGIVNYDGTHVYALDTATGKLRWQNNSTGHLDPEARTGVGVQGHLLVQNGGVFLAGGNVLSPAVYSASDGRLLNDPSQFVGRRLNNNVPSSISPRGSDLYSVGQMVMVAGKPLYAHPEYDVYDNSVERKILATTVGERDVLWINNALVQCVPRIQEDRGPKLMRAWRDNLRRDFARGGVEGLSTIWQYNCEESRALAVAQNSERGGGGDRNRSGRAGYPDGQSTLETSLAVTSRVLGAGCQSGWTRARDAE
jgi:outer membrane protein assembly factor BamB